MQREEFDHLFRSIKKSHYDEPKPDIAQSPDELWWVLQNIFELRPQIIVEIGTEYGGTSWFWERTLSPEGLLITVDIQEYSREPGKFCDFSQVRAEVIFKAGVSSQDPQTVLDVQRILGERPVDFLYIDGDHNYEAVKTDYELWTPLVRPGGLVGFHDTNDVHIRRMLAEKNHPRLEFMDRGFGTGLIRGW